MNPAAEAAIGAGDGVLAPYHPGEVEDAVGDDLRVLYDVGGVTDDARDQDFSVGQLDVSPDFPLVLVPDVAGLDRVSANANLKQDVDDVPEWQIGGMRPVPAAPAYVAADPILGQTAQGWLLPK